MGMGTPISQSNIERMHASFCLQIPDVDTFHRAGTGFRRYGEGLFTLKDAPPLA